MCDFLAFYPAKLLLYTPLTPNQITILWVLIKLAMLPFIAFGNHLTIIVSLLVFQLASILDGSDGIVARFRKKFSLNGTYIDLFGHYICNSLLLIALSIIAYRQTANSSYLILGAIATFIFLASKALTINPMWYKSPEEQKKIEKIIYENNLSLKEEKNRFIAIVHDLLLMDNPFNVMFFGVLFQIPEITLLFYAIFVLLEFLRKLWLQFYRIYHSERENGM